MRGGWLAVGLLGTACASGTFAPEGQPPADASRPAGDATPKTAGSAGSGSGSASLPVTGDGAGAGAGPVTGTGTTAPQTPSVTAACTLRVTASGKLRQAPAAPGQRYLRCASAGSDLPWRVTMSPDGTRVAARTGLGTVRLIATDGWREVVEIVSPIGRLDAAAFSPDGTQLAVMSAEAGEITVWDARDGALLRTLAGPPAPTIDRNASALAFSSDGRRLATSLGTIADIASGESIQWTQSVRYRSPPPPYALAANPQMLYDGTSARVLRFIAGDATLITEESYQIGNSPPTVRIAAYDTTTGGGRVFYEAYGHNLFGYALLPDGTRLAISSYDYASPGSQLVLRVLRTANGELVKSSTSSGAVFAFTADGASVLVSDGVVDVRDAESLASVARYALPAQSVLRGLLPAGRLVVSSPTATFWLSPLTGVVLRQQPFPTTDIASSAEGAISILTGDTGASLHVSSLDGRGDGCVPGALPAGDRDWPYGFTELPTASALFKTPPVVGGSTIYDAAVSPDGALVAGTINDANGGGTRFGVWRVADATAKWLTPADSGGAPAWFSRDSGVVAARLFALHTHASNYYAYNVWNAATGDLLRLYGADVRALAAVADGGQLATREGSGIAIWCR